MGGRIERFAWLLTASAPVALAANVLFQTKFHVEPAIVIARATPLSAFIQTGLVWVFIGVSAVLALALATAGSALFRTGHRIAGPVACFSGIPLLIPYFMQLFNLGSVFAFAIPMLYVAYCFALPHWWPPYQGDIFRWVLPVAAVFGTFVPVIITPLPQVSVTYGSNEYFAQIVQVERGEALLYDSAHLRFYTYPVDHLHRITPCFLNDNIGELAWLAPPKGPQPVCPKMRLPSDR